MTKSCLEYVPMILELRPAAVLLTKLGHKSLPVSAAACQISWTHASKHCVYVGFRAFVRYWPPSGCEQHHVYTQ